MKPLYGYVRVSTAKQGQHGSSLQEQRDAIENYARRHSLVIAAWFEEQETAAKRGRSCFNRMLKLLKQGKAGGVIIHKIDRSARNLRDWADLGELIDSGVDVHFANESLDLQSRGGRLSADIQAVVAADYIRNLREEVRKGFYGRLKQGLYPLPAPIGYLDRGAGAPKAPDPNRAPFIRQAFELYATAAYSLDTLNRELFRRGLRTKKGNPLSQTSLSYILNNPFYYGLVRIKATGESFPGVHKPLITTTLFNRVQDVLHGKTNTKIIRHDFLFRRLVACKLCAYTLIGERQKGHVYYRCHTKDCPTTGIREEAIDLVMKERLGRLVFVPQELSILQEMVAQMAKDADELRYSSRKALALKLDALTHRLNRLTDAYLDGAIDQSLFHERKEALIEERITVENEVAHLEEHVASLPERLARFLERTSTLLSRYIPGMHDEKREAVLLVTSNRTVERKSVAIALRSPFQEIANRSLIQMGEPSRSIPRTAKVELRNLLNNLTVYMTSNRSDVMRDPDNQDTRLA